MGRLIDADKLLDDITAIENSSGMRYIIASTFKRYINQQPTITIPEIVYCQNCVHHEDGCVQTGMGNIYVCPNDSEFFCKFGRKKDVKSD